MSTLETTVLASSHRLRRRLLRTIVIALGLIAWFWTQALLGRRVLPASGVGDMIHVWTTPIHDYLFTHARAGNLVLIASSAVIDAVGVFLILASIFGASIRPFIALLMLFALRQVCQSLCRLPIPEGMIWHETGVPTLLVTYGTGSDLFFSGHTALAVLGAVELSRLRRRLIPIGILIALGEAFAVLVLRAHYTMDVFTGAVTALYVANLAGRIAPAIDRRLR